VFTLPKKAMEYRYLGKTGLQVSALSLGSWITFGNQISDEVAEALMIKAYDKGVNFFDNAELYANGKSEIVMGNILKKQGWSRDTWMVSSKVYWGGKLPNQYGLSRKHVIEACHAALKRLQVDYLDLYYCHRPDKNTPIEETVAAMTDLIRQGKVLYWGTSEWSAEAIREAYEIAKRNYMVAPVVEQPQYNMFHRERVEVEYRRLYAGIGLGTTIWSPLASGILTGKYYNSIPAGSRMEVSELQWLRDFLASEEGKKRIEKSNELMKLAAEIGTTLPKLAIAWCLKNPNVSSVILGATKVSQLEENLDALNVVPLLTDSVMEQIETILGNKPKYPAFG
jgi:voltage-dependent potassium channel beta subunit